jgi:hypothetical protein
MMNSNRFCARLSGEFVGLFFLPKRFEAGPFSETDEQLPLDWINPDGFFVYKILFNQN